MTILRHISRHDREMLRRAIEDRRDTDAALLCMMCAELLDRLESAYEEIRKRDARIKMLGAKVAELDVRQNILSR